MTLPSFRRHQKEADEAIYQHLVIENNNKCLVKMFCGTGKSLLMRKCKIVKNKNLCVYVFSSLGLIEQFTREYLNDHPMKNLLKICSEVESTTDPIAIQKFLKIKSKKIICVTYQSFKTLVDNLNDTRIDICIFDEAHNAVGETYQTHIFENNICDKQVFMTATPKNANGITMCEPETKTGACGKLVYEYTYLQGVNDDILNPFEIRIDMFTENCNKSLYECIARAIIASGNGRVLTFHGGVDTESDTCVNKFLNEREFTYCFEDVQRREFPEKNGHYQKITMTSLSSSTPSFRRESIFRMLDETPDNEVIVVSSCQVLREGIDTKKANMCVFVDPKSYAVQIIQNIGRILRKTQGILKPNSTILLPCWVDKEKYLACDGDREKCDAVIREDMGDSGNFNGILNVMSALKQEDEELYDICLHYPDTYSPQEIKSNLEKQGFQIIDPVDEDGNLQENLEHVLDTELDMEEYEDCETDEEVIMRVAEDKDVCIEIHTNSLENPIERYNTECETGYVVRLYKSVDEETEEEMYQPIVSKEGGKKRAKGTTNPPNRNRRLRIKVHTNPDVKVLWNIKDFDSTKDICSCVIDCEVVVDNIEVWKDKLEQMKKYIDENKNRPQYRSENKEVAKIAKWMQHQITNYNDDISKCKDIMKNDEINALWCETIENPKYRQYLVINNISNWKEKLEQMKKYIDEHKKTPSKRDKNNNFKQLGAWISAQKNKYNPEISKCKQIMKEKEVNELWRQTVEDVKYKPYLLIDNIAHWQNKLEEVKCYIDKNHKRPSANDENAKTMGLWIYTQTQNYNEDIDKSKRTMKNKEIHGLWKETINDEKYKSYLVNDNVLEWKNNYEKMKQYMNIEKKKPSTIDENEEIKSLAHWIGTQFKNYHEDIKKSKRIMEKKEIHALWKQILENPNYVPLLDKTAVWKNSLQQMEQYINDNKKRPSSTDKNENIKTLGNWVCNQIQNYDIDISKCKRIMKNEEIYVLWRKTLEKYGSYLVIDNISIWKNKLHEMKEYIDKNNKRPSEKLLCNWVQDQVKNYDIDISKCKRAMKNKEIHALWTQTIQDSKYNKYFPKYQSLLKEAQEEEEDIINIIIFPKKKSMKLSKTNVKPKEETPQQKRQRNKSKLTELHRTYKTMKSSTLTERFEQNPQEWHEYHEISEENEKTIPEEEIPRNQIINEMNHGIISRKRKEVVDLGCGKAQISKYFKDSPRFNFTNYDLVACDESVTVCDISKTPLEDNSVDIAILSLAMWCTNREDNIKEAYRILDSQGLLFISEATKKWSELDEHGNIIEGTEASKLIDMLQRNGFHIKKRKIEKFCMFVCMKM